MASFAVGFGALLIALGAWGYLGAEEPQRSFTALIPAILIPAILGVLLVLLGLLAFKESRRKHAMHAAAALGLIGLLAAGARLIVALNGGKTLSERGPQGLAGMAVLCGVFVALCVNSFIAARRARRQAENKPPV
jgi:hypothetical protein